MIPLRDQEQLRQLFSQRLTGGVKIEHFSQRPLSIFVPGREDCRFCKEARQALEELRALSPKISLRVHELSEAREEAARQGVDRVPATILRGQLNRPISFCGFFSGTLFMPFIETLIDVSRGATSLDARRKRRLQRVRNEVTVRLFVSPACPYSPPMMRSLYQFALENRRIHATVIEAEEFPALVEFHGIEAVPYTLIGDRVSLGGALPEEMLLDQIQKVSEGQTLVAGEGLTGAVGRPMTRLSGLDEPRPTRSGLIIPGR